ncbi:MAG: transporter [Nakamurella sp.]
MERFILVLVLVGLCLLAGFGIYHGWRRRALSQATLPQLAAEPTDLGPDLVEPVTGLYISTTTAGDWQDRIVAQGLGRRAAGAVRLSAEGVCIERDGESDVFLPTADLLEVTTAPGIAGKVVGMANGVLVIRWLLGPNKLESGFRANDTAHQSAFIAAANTLIANSRGTEPQSKGAST